MVGGRGALWRWDTSLLSSPDPDGVWNAWEPSWRQEFLASPCIFQNFNFPSCRIGVNLAFLWDPESSILKSDTFPGAEYIVATEQQRSCGGDGH